MGIFGTWGCYRQSPFSIPAYGNGSAYGNFSYFIPHPTCTHFQFLKRPFPDMDVCEQVMGLTSSSGWNSRQVQVVVQPGDGLPVSVEEGKTRLSLLFKIDAFFIFFHYFESAQPPICRCCCPPRVQVKICDGVYTLLIR